MSFKQNVFVNCPFDDEYLPLLRPLLFTIAYLGFSPRISLEELDSGKLHIQKIIRLVESSQYAIHDLSRLQARRAGEYYRLNMPFELGIDVGCRLFGRGQRNQKRCLVLEEQHYRYQAALSDLSNSDIAVHGGSPERLVAEVRNWLNSQARLRSPGPTRVWTEFLEFMVDNNNALKQRDYSDRDIEHLPVNELMHCIEDWVRAKRTGSRKTGQNRAR